MRIGEGLINGKTRVRGGITENIETTKTGLIDLNIPC
jgi:hypothetical protein